MPLLVVSFCDNIIEPGKNSEAKLAEKAAKLARLQTWLEGQQYNSNQRYFIRQSGWCK